MAAPGHPAVPRLPATASLLSDPSTGRPQPRRPVPWLAGPSGRVKPIRDPAGSRTRQDPGPVDSGIEGGGREPSDRTGRKRREKRLHRLGHAVGLGRPADDQQIHAFEARWCLVDVEEPDLAGGLKRVGDGLGDGLGVAAPGRLQDDASQDPLLRRFAHRPAQLADSPSGGAGQTIATVSKGAICQASQDVGDRRRSLVARRISRLAVGRR